MFIVRFYNVIFYDLSIVEDDGTGDDDGCGGNVGCGSGWCCCGEVVVDVVDVDDDCICT